MLSISQISAQILLGSSPKDIRDVRELFEKHAVDSVLSLQTDADLRIRKINIELLKQHYQQRKMNFFRFPIDDVDPEDMVEKILQPIEYLGQQIQLGKTVYVHCNAGICRAPSTVLGYLTLFEGMDLTEGLHYIRQRRAFANPYVAAVREALEESS